MPFPGPHRRNPFISVFLRRRNPAVVRVTLSRELFRLGPGCLSFLPRLDFTTKFCSRLKPGCELASVQCRLAMANIHSPRGREPMGSSQLLRGNFSARITELYVKNRVLNPVVLLGRSSSMSGLELCFGFYPLCSRPLLAGPDVMSFGVHSSSPSLVFYLPIPSQPHPFLTRGDQVCLDCPR